VPVALMSKRNTEDALVLTLAHSTVDIHKHYAYIPHSGLLPASCYLDTNCMYVVARSAHQ